MNARMTQLRSILLIFVAALLAIPNVAAGEADRTQSPAELGISRDDPWSSPAVAAPDLSERTLQRSNAALPPDDASAAIVATRGNSKTGGWVRTVGALAGVVALIVVLAWGYRATAGMSSRFGLATGNRDNLIQVVSRKFLSPRSSVALLRVGDHMVLVGIQNDGMRTLDVIDDPDMVARLAGNAESTSRSSSVRQFNRALSDAANEYGEAEGGADDLLDDKTAHITRVRERLQGTLQRLRALADRG